MARNKASDESGADWLSHTRLKNYRDFSYFITKPTNSRNSVKHLTRACCIFLWTHADDVMEPLKCLSVSFQCVWRLKLNFDKIVSMLLVRSYRASAELWMYLRKCQLVEKQGLHKAIASLVLSNLQCASITQRSHGKHKPIVKFRKILFHQIIDIKVNI